jgi:hypothetical protein
LTAQRCAWITRAYNNTCDNWRYDLKSLAPNNNISLIRSSDVDANLHPILHGICKSYDHFINEFSKCNGNYKKVELFENEVCTVGPRDNQSLINKDFFGRNFYDIYRHRIRTLTVDSCISENNHFKSVAEFREEGLPVTIAVWMRLRSAVLKTRNDYKKPDPALDNKALSLHELLRKKLTGSKPFRIYLEWDRRQVNVAGLRVVNTFAELVNLPVPDCKTIETSLGALRFYYLNADLKNFMFRFRNNSLPLSNRLQNYEAGVDPTCFFCRVRNVQIRESFLHCFYECLTFRSWLQQFYDRYFDIRINSLEGRNFFWYGVHDTIATKSQLLSIILILDILRYTAFKYKRRKILPTFDTIHNDFVFQASIIMKTSRIFEHEILSFPLLARLARALG